MDEEIKEEEVPVQTEEIAKEGEVKKKKAKKWKTKIPKLWKPLDAVTEYDEVLGFYPALKKYLPTPSYEELIKMKDEDWMNSLSDFM